MRIHIGKCTDSPMGQSHGPSPSARPMGPRRIHIFIHMFSYIYYIYIHRHPYIYVYIYMNIYIYLCIYGLGP